MGSHFNTTNESGQILMDYEGKAKSLEVLIRDLFLARPAALLTPFEVKKIIDRLGREYPITSVRRGMTNLSSKDNGFFLRKTTVKRKEQWDRPNHYWTLNNSIHI